MIFTMNSSNLFHAKKRTVVVLVHPYGYKEPAIVSVIMAAYHNQVVAHVNPDSLAFAVSLVSR